MYSAVIGSNLLFSGSEERGVLLGLVDPDDFHNRRNGAVWRAIRYLATREGGTPTTRIRDVVDEMGWTPGVEDAYLSRLVDHAGKQCVPSRASARGRRPSSCRWAPLLVADVLQ
ncbi:hypothetical protein [Actinopolymorpha alba]|uniref:hypothetical protein n=1 Tax=Actinopolymorpha alba TaxID=533267 RepID=UPI0003624B93|nr:hypothetical protein [Actinopolymorpha alba]